MLFRSTIVTHLISKIHKSLAGNRVLRDRLQTTIDTIPTMVVCTKPDGSTEFHNKRWQEFLGSEEMNSWNSVHSDDRPGLEKDRRQAIATGEPFEAEARWRRCDGEFVWLLARAVPERDESGRIIRWYVTLTDIEDRKRTEKAFEEINKSEVRLRTIIDTIPAMVWCSLPDGFAEFHNQRWLDYTGLSDEEGRGWGWRAAFHPEDSQAAVDDWRDITASKRPSEGERLIRRFDGEYRRYMYRAEPLMDDQGNVVRWYGTITDIEDRKRAEDSLRSSEQNFRRIVNSIPGYVCALTASGEIEFVNNQVLEYFGKTLDELKNWAASDTVYPDDLPDVIATWRTSIETGQPTDVELRLRRADGIYRWFLLRRLPQRDSQGQVVRWYTMHTDIEDRKQAEDNIRRSETELRQILEFAPQYVTVLAPDRDRTPLYANQMVLDYSNSCALIGQSWGSQ